MSERLYGGAFVILPKQDSLQISSAIVGGSRKDDMTLESHEMTPFDVRGDALASELHGRVSAFAKRVVNLQGPGQKVPVTCGIANSIDMVGSVSGFNDKRFRKTLKHKTIKQLLPQIPNIGTILLQRGMGLDERTEMQREIVGQLVFHILGDLFLNGTNISKRLIVDKRLYSSAHEMDGVDDSTRLSAIEMAVGIDATMALKLLIANLEDGGEIGDEERELVKLGAIRYAEVSRQQFEHVNRSTKPPVQRFINIAHPDDIRNAIFKHPELKEIFIESYMSILKFDHNICYKAEWEKPNPPFSDVVATFLADKIDLQEKTSPTSVGVQVS